MAVPNHALLCHRYGALIHGAGSPITSNIKRTALSQTTGLLTSPRHLSHKKRNLPAKYNQSCTATAGSGEREVALEDEMQGLVRQASLQGTEHADKLKGGLTLGVTMAGWLGSYQPLDCATAAESSEAITEAATRTAPEWVAPFVLAVPVVSYLLFTFYRSKVNPYAKLTDWVFGLVAMAILGNLILIATVGVRLY